MLNCANLVKFYSNYDLSFAGTVNLALVPFTCSAQWFFDSLFQLKNFSKTRSCQLSSSSSFEGHPLQVRHKQDWGRGFILLLFQATVLPESDAGSGVIKTASSFVIQNCQTSCSMWCPMYRARCSYMVCGLLRGTTLAIR